MEKKRTLKVKKVNNNDHSIVLEGAVFDVYDDEDQKVATLTTDATGYASQVLPKGTYKIK